MDSLHSKAEESWKELKYEEVKSAVERGDESAKTKLAWLMLSGLGGADVDEDGAVALLEERVKDRDSDAMRMLGVCYEYGRGIEQDIERAETLYKGSRSKGNKIGAFFASHREYERGSGHVYFDRLQTRLCCNYIKQKLKIQKKILIYWRKCYP